MSSPVVVLGAGPAGIGAALALDGAATVLESSGRAGGLSRSLVLDGAIFDLGGHSFHTPHPHVRDLVFGALEMEEQRRDAWCWVRGDWIAYPFQKHVGDLADPVLRAACIADMASAPGGGGAAHFDAYIDARFGRAVADAFMRPYNRKLWGDDLSRLTTDWTGERVAGSTNEVERFVEHGGARTPLQSDTRVAYPARGGFGAIFEALAARIGDLRLGTSVERIEVRTRTLTTNGGEVREWERLVSTLPLPALLAMVDNMPPSLIEAVAGLETVPTDLVMLVLEGQGPVDRQRVYTPDPEIPGHKIVLNHTSTRWLRDQPRHGIQVEVSGARPHGADVVERVVGDLVRIGLLRSRAEVRRAERLHLPFGYPKPTHARDTILRDVRAWLAAHGIEICGRFAEWAYINADEALARGLAVGARLGAGVSAVL